ncbi:MAG: DUF2442 domain-containing protein [Verrucomicrobia bacterium]|nr:DUF2442 domain-containing protein [Verrucomicrobiota bacterium]
MSTWIDNVASAVHLDGMIVVTLRSGSEIRFPAALNPRLAQGTPQELGRIEIFPFGLHWPDLDEDLSIRGILAGDYGQRPMH